MNLSDSSILTIVTPATSKDLTVLSNVKTELGLTDGKQDARLKLWITRASAIIAQHCNRVFAIEAVQEEVWLRREPYPYKVSGGVAPLQLARWPVITVTSVTENAVALVDRTDYRVVYDKGQLLRLDTNLNPRPWYPRPAPIVVQYTAGFDLKNARPSDLEHACIEVVKMLYFAADRDPRLMSRNVDGVIDQRWWVASGAQAGALPPEIADLVDNYRVPVAA